MCLLHLPGVAARICPAALHLAKKEHGKELHGNRAERWEMGTEVGLWGREELNKAGRQEGVLKDELWFEGGCWSWSEDYGLANEICWSTKGESIVDIEKEQNSLLERLGWEKC